MMLMFCTKRGANVSRWYDYPESVEGFIDTKGAFLQKDVVFCFVQNEHVWIYEDNDLYEVPALPDWVPDFNYDEFDFY